MRAVRAALLGCVGALALAAVALAALLWLVSTEERRAAGEPSPAPRPLASPTPLPEAFASHVGRLGEFRSELPDDRYRLSYAFIDHHGRTHRVSCSVGRAALEAERRSFGYEEEAFKTEYNRRLKALVDGEIAARGLRPYLAIRFHGWGAYHWSWNVPGVLEAEERDRVQREIEQLTRWLGGPFEKQRDSVRAELFKSVGILDGKDHLSIDYAFLADRALGSVSSCFDALWTAGKGSTIRQYLGLFVAFFQELTYEIPPDVDNGRHILGLWVPSDVLVRGRGDCDSKSAAFAAMWRRMPTALLFIILPKHVLVAVEAPPWPGENFVRLGNRTFLFSEVAGPGKSRPGFKAPEGNYEYVLFEPDRASPGFPLPSVVH